MFDHLQTADPDPVLGISAAFCGDDAVVKVDLGVGVYRDEQGHTPIQAAVRQAERELIDEQTTKTYLSPLGNDVFNYRLSELLLGKSFEGVSGRLASVQTVGGSGALRLGGELLNMSRPSATVHVSTPTWPNHYPLLNGAGLRVESYAYYSGVSHEVEFDRMMSLFESLDPGSVVVLQAGCHNPTGQDLSANQWEAIANTVEKRGLIPFLDLAYYGLAVDCEADAAPIRLLASRVPEMLVAVSCSKSFGLYRDRTGLLMVFGSSASRKAMLLSQLVRLVRTLYSMPPDNGAAIVARVIGDSVLRPQWMQELASMTTRIQSLRDMFSSKLAARLPGHDFRWIQRQTGMFSRLEILPNKVVELRDKHHVYIAPDGRVNIAGVSPRNVDHVVEAIASVGLNIESGPL